VIKTILISLKLAMFHYPLDAMKAVREKEEHIIIWYNAQDSNNAMLNYIKKKLDIPKKYTDLR
jgi:hypothetical protein